MTDTTAITIRAAEPDGLDQLDRALATFGRMGACGMLPKGVQSAADAAALAAFGSSYGLDPLQSVWRLHIIEGRPSLPAETMVALVVRHPACEWWRMVESTDTRATYETMRTGHPEPTRLAYTMEQARQAGLGGRGPWKAHPAAMLRARCSSALARIVYPDVVGGLYDPDEAREAAGEYQTPARQTQTYRATSAPPEVIEAEVIETPHEQAAGSRQSEVPQEHRSIRPDMTWIEQQQIGGAPFPLTTTCESRTTPGVNYCQTRFAPGAWSCDCEKGRHTAKGEHSDCHHTARAELYLASRVMGGAWEVIARDVECDDPQEMSPAQLRAALEMWHDWHAAEE